MFDTTRAFSSFAVPNTSAAKSFYRDTLGIEPVLRYGDRHGHR